MEVLLNATNYTQNESIPTPNQQIPVIFQTILYCIGMLTSCANLPSIFIVIASLWRRKKLRFVHVLCLSFTDALVGISWIVFTDTLNGREMGYTDCYLRIIFLGVTFFASLFQVLAICIDRVLVVCMNAINIRLKRNKVSAFIVGVSWTLAISVNLSVTSTFFIDYTANVKCSFDDMFGDNKKRAYGILGLVLGLVQVAVLISMIIFLQFLLRYSFKVKESATIQIKKSDIKLCITTGLIVILYSVCNSPLTIVYLKDGYISEITSSRYLRNISFLFAGLSSALNPFIYLLRITPFRSLLYENMKYFKPCKNSVFPP